MSKVEDLLCALMRGKGPSWPVDADTQYASNLLERAEYHGVLSLAHDQLQREPEIAKDWPPAIVKACRDTALGQAMWELQHRSLLTQVLEQLALIGVRPVLFKGTALAYGLYPEGAIRSRGDTDLIIPSGSLPQVDTALTALGFERETGMSGEFVSYQGSYTHVQPGVGGHTLDVHWRINNSELLSRLFTHAELLERASPLPQLSPLALAAGLADALLIACMHRATHKENPYYVDGVAHYSGDRLIWLYDIHLLLNALSPAQCDEFIAQADAKGLRAVCLEGIEKARASFHTPVSDNILTALGRKGMIESPARYLNGSRWRQQWMDFVALGSPPARLRFVRETVFPPAHYMRQKYPNANNGVAWLYLQRAVGGLTKRLRRANR